MVDVTLFEQSYKDKIKDLEAKEQESIQLSKEIEEQKKQLNSVEKCSFYTRKTKNWKSW